MYKMGYSDISEWTTPKKHEEVLRSIKQTNNGHRTDWSLTSAGTEHQVTSVVAAALTACTQASRWEMTLALWKLRGQTPMTPMSNFLESVKLWSAIQLTILMHIHNLWWIISETVLYKSQTPTTPFWMFSFPWFFLFFLHTCALVFHRFRTSRTILSPQRICQRTSFFNSFGPSSTGFRQSFLMFPIGTIVILNTVPLHRIHEIGFWIQDQRIDERCKEDCSCIFSAYTFFLLHPTSLPLDVHFFSYFFGGRCRSSPFQSTLWSTTLSSVLWAKMDAGRKLGTKSRSFSKGQDVSNRF